MHGFNHLCRCKVQNSMCYVIWTLRISELCRWFVRMKGKQRSMLGFRRQYLSNFLANNVVCHWIHHIVRFVGNGKNSQGCCLSFPFFPFSHLILFQQISTAIHHSIILFTNTYALHWCWTFFICFFFPSLVLLCKVTREYTKVACPLCTLSMW